MSKPVWILIDGLNLLHVTGVFTESVSAPGLPGATKQQSCSQLVRVLAEGLGEKARRRTTVVFDGVAGPDSPTDTRWNEIRVIFSGPKLEADDVIERLLSAAKSPKEILVVSSDHRVQAAARRVGAHPVDSETWWRDLEHHSRARPSESAEIENRNQTVEPTEARGWMNYFGFEGQAETSPKETASHVETPPLSSSYEAISTPSEDDEESFGSSLEDFLFPLEFLEDLQEWINTEDDSQ